MMQTPGEALLLKTITGMDPEGNSLEIANSPAITDLKMFTGLQGALKGGLRISSNAKLQNLKGLEKITTIGTNKKTWYGVRKKDVTSLFVSHNEELESARALRGAWLDTTKLVINGNTQLSCLPSHWPRNDKTGGVIQAAPCTNIAYRSEKRIADAAIADSKMIKTLHQASAAALKAKAIVQKQMQARLLATRKKAELRNIHRRMKTKHHKSS
jgi:hypothetical protein